MKKVLVCALALVASSAFASSCPKEMKAIDAALAAKPMLTQANMSQVQKLRADGEKLHAEGKHDESLKALNEAKKLLGI